MKREIKNSDIHNFDIIIIDFMNVFYRYKYSLRMLKSSEGIPTGVFYGVLNFIIQLKEKYKKAEIVFACDRNPKVKKELSIDYKSNRDSSKYLENKKDIDLLTELLSLYGVKQFYAEGYEADDIAHKLVKENEDKKILLYSNDNDWFSFLNDNVFINKSNKIFSKKDIESENDIIDVSKQNILKAIIGEKKENVHGIKRFPRKIANKLISKANSIEEVFSICELYKNKNKWLVEILNNKEKILLNYKLKSTIYDGYKIEEIDIKKDWNRLFTILKSLDVNSLCEKLK